MAMRSRSWNEGLAKRLRQPGYASEFLCGLLEEGLTLQEALATTIKAYGVTEFSEIAGIPESNIHRAIDPDHNPTRRTLETLLSPLGLKLSAERLTA